MDDKGKDDVWDIPVGSGTLTGRISSATGRIIDTDAEWQRLMQTANDQVQTITGRLTDADRKALKHARFLEMYGQPGPVITLHTPTGIDDGRRIMELIEAGHQAVFITMDFGDIEDRILTSAMTSATPESVEAEQRLFEDAFGMTRETVIIGGRRVSQGFGKMGLAAVAAAASIGSTSFGNWDMLDVSPEPVQPINPNDFRDLGHPNERRRFGNNKSLTNTVKARLAKKLAKKSKQKNRK